MIFRKEMTDGRFSRSWGDGAGEPSERRRGLGVARRRRGEGDVPRFRGREALGCGASRGHRGAFVRQTDRWHSKPGKKAEAPAPSGLRGRRRHHKARGEIAPGAR